MAGDETQLASTANHEATSDDPHRPSKRPKSTSTVHENVAEGVIYRRKVEEAKTLLAQRAKSINESKTLLQAVVMAKKTKLARDDQLFGKHPTDSIRVLLLSELLVESESIVNKLDEHLEKVVQQDIECDLALSHLEHDGCNSGSGDKETTVQDSFCTVEVPNNQDLVGDGKALQSYVTKGVRMAWMLQQM